MQEHIAVLISKQNQKAEVLREKEHLINSLETQLLESEQRATQLQEQNQNLEKDMAARADEYGTEIDTLRITLEQKKAEVSNCISY